MTSEITAILAPTPEATRLLVMAHRNEIVRAVLGPPSQTHWRAAPTLLEGLALWYQRPLHVVLSVDVSNPGLTLALQDGFGFGDHRLHYAVDVVETSGRGRGHRLGGRGDFQDLRALGRRWGMR
jgi:hypothetical protein